MNRIIICLSLVMVQFFWVNAASRADSERGGILQRNGRAETGADNVIYEDWIDAKRNRTVPVKIYLPKSDGKPSPVVIFSHGLGGTRDAAQYLGQRWSSAGYLCIFVQHPGSDDSVWQGTRGQGEQAFLASMRGAANGEQLLARVYDIKFVLDELERRNNQRGVLQGKCNLDEIAITGHSFGAGTSMAIAGESYAPAGRTISMADPRVKAAIYLSAPPDLHGRTPQEVFGGIKIPGLLMTGTEDTTPIRETKPEERRLPFDGMTAKHQYLVIFNGGDHMIFNGATRRAPRKGDAQMISEIERLTTAFLDAYLRGDKQEQAWLDKDAASYLTDASLERK